MEKKNVLGLSFAQGKEGVTTYQKVDFRYNFG